MKIQYTNKYTLCFGAGVACRSAPDSDFSSPLLDKPFIVWYLFECKGGGRMIARAQVENTLRPWLGTALTSALDAQMDALTVWLNAFSLRADPERLAGEMDSLLFCAIRDATRGTMLARLPDDTWVRIRVEDFSAMADELMGLVFARFPADAAHLQFLRDYSLRCSSLSALRTLYTRFQALQTKEELATIATVAKGCYPPFRLRGWLL